MTEADARQTASAGNSRRHAPTAALRTTCGDGQHETGTSDTLTLDQTQYSGTVRLAVRGQGSWMVIVEVYS